MIINCKHCSAKFEITQDDLDFYDKVSPKFNGVKYLIPTPTHCPDCRQQRRLAFRNERKLYKRRCSATEKNIISIYSPDKPLTVYSQEEWWSDKWDGIKYGRDFDFNKSFFEQFKQLSNVIPCISLINYIPENSEYCNQTTGMKNSYLCYNAIYSENSLYSKGLSKCKDVVDCLRAYNSEKCYECIDCHECYNGIYLQNCTNCSDCSFCYDCQACKNCFGCANLRNKQYYIFNKKYNKDNYHKELKIIQEKYSFVQCKQELLKIELKVPHKHANINNCENCLGDSIHNSKNAYNSYDIVGCKDVKFCYDLRASNANCYDTSFVGDNIENSYELTSSGINMKNSAFVSNCWIGVSNILYSDFCGQNCSYLFGCVGIRQKSYCILNKQYTKKEYNILVPKIIKHMKKTGEWGEYFPAKLSPFAYNETVAQEYFPLTKDEVLNKGWKWKDEDTSLPKATKIIPAEKLPIDISNIPDDILSWAIQCKDTQKSFKIIPQELKFYRENNIPIPRLHPDERHAQRMKLRNPRRLYDRKCNKCEKQIQTTYSPARPEIIYCEECYLKEIY